MFSADEGEPFWLSRYRSISAWCRSPSRSSKRERCPGASWSFSGAPAFSCSRSPSSTRSWSISFSSERSIRTLNTTKAPARRPSTSATKQACEEMDALALPGDHDRTTIFHTVELIESLASEKAFERHKLSYRSLTT